MNKIGEIADPRSLANLYAQGLIDILSHFGTDMLSDCGRMGLVLLLLAGFVDA